MLHQAKKLQKVLSSLKEFEIVELRQMPYDISDIVEYLDNFQSLRILSFHCRDSEEIIRSVCADKWETSRTTQAETFVTLKRFGATA